ncbi:MAG: hypothetical protein J2P45_26200 [Candidatus Dormibacteraeota bacterium]|nr:hypothetical protein [Candidatus Dormibacteraeota bacterium]
MRCLRCVLPLAALLLVSCGSQTPTAPVKPAACQPTPTHREGSSQAIAADPSDSTIRGLLQDGPYATAGRPFPIQWVMDSRKAGKVLHMRAVREGTDQVIGRNWEGTASGLIAVFPAEITFPASGCWAADLSTGTADGEVVFRVN